MFKKNQVWVPIFLILAGAAQAQTPDFDSGSTGALGPLNTNVDMLIQLPTDGILQYTEVNIGASATIRFIKPTDGNPPVHLLVAGDAIIDGTIDIRGENGGDNDAAGGRGGPGGFDGGTARNNDGRGGNGQGPGGGVYRSGFGSPGAGGTFSTSGQNNPFPTYGTPELLPLIGGSGGGGTGGSVGNSSSGAGGGGAINVAASGNITLNGRVLATGGDAVTFSGAGSGSGGAVRLMADNISGSGEINAKGLINGNDGGDGRIRLEGFTISENIVTSPGASKGFPGPVMLSPTPTLAITSIAGANVPANPTGRFPADVGVPGGFSNPAAVQVEANNVPLGTQVTVRVIPEHGESSTNNTVEVLSAPLAGTEAASSAIASVTMPSSGRGTILAFIDMVSPIVNEAKGIQTGKATEKIRIQTGPAGETQYFRFEGDRPEPLNRQEVARLFR